MRITGGEHKGRTINTPHSDSLRPSQDQVRLALFSILESGYLSGFYYDELTVADLFAGTGALGLEALSRGVARVDFVEQNKAHTKAIKKTIVQINKDTNSHIYAEDVWKYLRRPVHHIYDIVFLDPPYKLFDEIKLDHIVPILKDHGVLIYLHSERDKPLNKVHSIDKEAEWILQETRNYGATGVSFYIRN